MAKLEVVIITLALINFTQQRPTKSLTNILNFSLLEEKPLTTNTHPLLTASQEFSEARRIYNSLGRTSKNSSIKGVLKKLTNWRRVLVQNHQHVWERSGQYQGDIILPTIHARNAMYNKKYYWPNKELPYEISESFSEKDRNTILETLDDLRNKTCIQPIPLRGNDTPGLYFSDKPGRGCSTIVGFWNKRQTLNLDVTLGCVQFGVVLHEILHSLGLWHQQSAHNRDDYIAINWGNIKKGQEYNFDKVERDSGSFGLPYDYDSIMHYSAYAFSRNGQKTITPKLKDRGSKMGQRTGLSQIDIEKLKMMYKCT